MKRKPVKLKRRSANRFGQCWPSPKDLEKLYAVMDNPHWIHDFSAKVLRTEK